MHRAGVSYGPIYVPFESTSRAVRDRARGREDGAPVHRLQGRAHEGDALADGTKAGEPVGVIVESALARPGDPVISPRHLAGAVKWHPAVWPRVESGELTGFSMGGDWTVVPILAAA